METNVQKGYNQWAQTYDDMPNKTRDLDKTATQTILNQLDFNNVLELGCGTGKNTEWLTTKAKAVTAVDFSSAMIEKAKTKITAGHVHFVQADITQPWPFENSRFDLVTCNLILEHIENLTPVFAEAARVLKPEGKFYISELHPFKQYTGSKARFEQQQQTIVLDCYVHHMADFFKGATAHGFSCRALNEWFDAGAENEIPRLVTFLFEKG